MILCIPARATFAAALCCAPLTAAPAQGQQVRPPDILAQQQDGQDGRYVFHEVDEGILRLDSRSGELSLCSRQNGNWTCRIVPDERAAVDAEIARLAQENSELRAALAARNQNVVPGAATPPPNAAKPDAQAAPGDPLLRLPTSEEMERARTVVTTIWHRLVEMMAKLRADLGDAGKR